MSLLCLPLLAISCVVIVLSLCYVYMLFRCSSYVVHVLLLCCPGVVVDVFLSVSCVCCSLLCSYCMLFDVRVCFFLGCYCDVLVALVCASCDPPMLCLSCSYVGIVLIPCCSSVVIVVFVWCY